MLFSSLRPTGDELEETVNTYSEALFRLCFTMLGCRTDAEDAVSDCIVRYIEHSPQFRDTEHKKAWLFRVASNICRDRLRERARHKLVALDDISELCASSEESRALELLLGLSDKYREVIHLHYIVGYSTAEIAAILRISPAAVRKRLQYAREQLKNEYRKEAEE